MTIMTSLENLITTGIAEHKAPCAVLHAFRKGQTPLTITAGTHTYDSDRAVRADDLFDLASITKILSTTTLAMLRVQQHRLDLDATIDTLLPERKSLPQPQPTIRQILAHCAGFAPFLPLYVTYADVPTIAERKNVVISLPAEKPALTETVYSDIGIMLLGIALERLGDQPFEQQVKDLIYTPLGMTETTFAPSPDKYPRCVPTEMKKDSNPPVPWQGIVHDENARWLDGIAGHAGLFSNVFDIAKFADVFLRNDGSFFDPAVVNLFTHRANLVPGSDRCLGWHGPSIPSSGGRFVSYNAFGHTGFTGTSFWVDPYQDIVVIFLTNAVHPYRADKKNYFPWRNDVHTMAYETLLA